MYLQNVQFGGILFLPMKGTKSDGSAANYCMLLLLTELLPTEAS